jgi:hypothetical protein
LRFKYGILGETGKQSLYDYYFKSLLARLNQLFVWDGLPESIDRDYLNAALFLAGFAAFFEKNDKPYIAIGGLGGSPNEYYYSTLFTMANPVLGSGQYNIHQNCEIMYNTAADKQLLHLADGGGGLYTLIDQTATLLTDNAQSINMAQINSRVQAVFTADNDRQKRSADVFLNRLYNGKPYSAFTADELQRFTVQNINVDTDKTITPLVELHQHILADFYNQIGIKTTPYNKQERLITAEVDTVGKMTECTLDSMLQARQEGCEAVNSLLGLNVSVRLADWLQEQEQEQEQEQDNNPDSDPDPEEEQDPEQDDNDKEGGGDE